MSVVCDFLGEKIASVLGISTPKYQYAIDEYYRMKKEVCLLFTFFLFSLVCLGVMGLHNEHILFSCLRVVPLVSLQNLHFRIFKIGNSLGSVCKTKLDLIILELCKVPSTYYLIFNCFSNYLYL